MPIDSIGKYYALPVIPSFDGMDRQVNSGMSKAFKGVGVKLGRTVGSDIASGLKASSGQVTAAAKSHVDALDKVKDATGRVAAEEKKLAAQRSNAASRAQAVGTAERRLQELRDGGTATAKQLEAAERSAAGARERARNAAAQTSSTEERVASLRRREAAATREAKSAEDELTNARRRASGVGGGANPLAGVAQGMRGAEGGMSSIAGGVGGKVGGAFMAGLAAVVSVAAVGALFKSAVDTGIDFERTVNAFSGVTNSGAEGMNKMRDAARALGTDTKLAGVSASDAGKAMLELAKGGMTADQAMAAARGTLQLATAGQIDAAEAAKIQSAAINMFSLKADDATHVADLLAAAANGSSADVSDLGLAMQAGGSAAAGFGVSIEDTLTALTMFSRMGINGSDAGTMLKTSLLAITDGGKPATEAINALGLQLYDTNGHFKGYESMMKQVADASKRMSEQEFQQAAAVLFGSDAMRASMVAAKGGAAAWDDAAKAVNRQGAAADMAAAQMQGLPGVTEALSNAWEGFKLKLFDVLDGPLIAIGNWFLHAIDGDGPPWLKNIGDAFVQIGGVAQQYLLPALTELWENIKGPLTEYGRQWVETFKEALPVIKIVAGAIGLGLLNAIKTLSVALPVVIKVMSGVAFAAQGVWAGIKLGGTVLMDVAGIVKDVFVGAWNLLSGAVSAAWSVLAPIWDGIKSGMSALGDAGRYVFDTVLVPAWHNLETAAGAAAAVLSPIWEGIKSGFSAVGDAANWLWTTAIVPVWEGIKTAFTAGWGAIAPIFEMIKGAFKGVSDFVSGVWSGLAGIVKGALDGVVGAVKGPLRWLGGVLQRVPLSLGPIEIPGAQVARDLGNTLAGLAQGGVAGRSNAGVLWGPGTGTSDSIVGVDAKGRPTALVSAGEGVVTNDAMGKGGAPVVAALNAGWVPSPALLHAMVPGYRGGGVVGPDVDAANSLAGTGYSQGNRTDCSGMVARVILRALGRETGGGLMSTKNAAEWLTKLGFKSGSGGAGAMTVGWYDRGPNPNDGHMAMTLSNGQHAEAGGSNGVFTIGSDAKGGDDPGFDQHMYLPIENLYGEGAGGGFGGYGGAAGGMAGGFDPPSPKAMREAQDRVSDRERGVTEKQALVDERQKKLDAAKPDQKESMQRQLDNAKADLTKATRERDEAKSDLEETKRGTPRKGSAAGDGKGGGSQLGDIGSIGSQFFKDTFGLGDLFPDPSQLGIVKLAQALFGIKYTPQGKGFPWQSGYAGGDGTPGSGSPADPFAGLVDGGSGGGGGLPLGMIPGVSSVLPDLASPTDPGSGGGAPGAAGNVDQSTNVTINNPQGTPERNEAGVRRVLLKTPRYGTYTQNPGVMGT